MNLFASEIEYSRSLLDVFVASWDSTISGPFVLVHHGDADGCCAAAAALHWAEQTGRARPNHVIWVGTSQFDFRALLDQLERLRATKIIFLDVNIANVPSALGELLRSAERSVTIYDDHLPEIIPSALNLQYLNPLVIGRPPREIPPCLFCSFLGSQYRTATSWVLGVGLMGESVADKYPEFFSQNGSLSKDRLRIAVQRVTSYYLANVGKDSNTALTLMLNAMKRAGVDDFLREDIGDAKQLALIANQVSAEVDRLSRDESLLVAVGNVLGYPFRAYEIQSKFRIANLVASRKRWQFRGEISIVFQRLMDRIIVEVRRSPEITDLDLSAVFQAATRNLDIFNVGGHPAAAGAAIKLMDMEKLIEAIKHL